MLKELNRVRGAVSPKDIVPVLTHFRIKDGTIQGTNGRLTLETHAVGLVGLDITVPAVKFLKAVDACHGEPSLRVTDVGNLVVKKDTLKVVLPLANNDDFPEQTPSDEYTFIDGVKLLGVCRDLYPFISADASRPWSCSIKFDGGFAYATNNVTLVRCKAPGTPDFVLPIAMIDELLRINLPPTGVTVTEHRIIFKLDGATWGSCGVLDSGWPDLDKFFDDRDTLVPIPADLLRSVETILPFCDNPKFPEIVFSEEGVSTVDGDMKASVGGVQLPDARYRAEPLLTVLNVATTADFSLHPAPFKGDKIDGILVGLRH